MLTRNNQLFFLTVLVWNVQRFLVFNMAGKGAPRGTVNNPKGINQYPGLRSSKMIALRLLKGHDPIIREKAEREGKSIAAILDDAIAFYLSANP
ncbi:MAG: hypothetical protein GPJ00_16340 [Microcystis aeruginosa W13-18]|nr:hypothetical protein [Microcystis aeruginosa W13-18]NCR36836.1 hypothetical protein [Microcystis aeruginosa S11-05]NCR50342.1 hypothetical protein [Microcystis aeruginosa S11-01]